MCVSSCFHCIGELGTGNTVAISETETLGSSSTVNVGTGAVVTAVSIGGDFICAIVNGTVKC
jgi:hypothetical protein